MSDESKAKPEITKSTPIKDVTDADKVAPSDTSKPIITNRPMVQDPMVKPETKDPELEQPATQESKAPTHGEKTLEVPESSDLKKPEDKKETQESTKQAEPAEDDTRSDTAKDSDTTPEDPNAEIKEADLKKAEHDAEIDKLIESKKYELPITTMEKRRSTRFVILGLVVALFLIMAWIDIALDAQLIQIDGISPVTHIFSN